MRAELLRFHEQMQTTIIYVTHDQVEAMTLADRIVVMNKGVILQVGTPFEVYNHPCNTFVAGFVGSPMMNFIDVAVVIENGGLFMQAQDFKLCMPRNLAERYQHLVNKEAILGIRPEHIFTRHQKNSFPGCEALMVNVEVVELLGFAIILEASLASSRITAVVDSQTQIKPHERTEFIIDMNQMHLFDKQTGEVC
jgi:multiple sugar transport system ATP-binding protein